MSTHFFVKDNVNLIIDRKLNDDWKEIKENEVINFLNNTGLSWHKDLLEDEVFVWTQDELIDGKCNILDVEKVENLNEFSNICQADFN